MTTTLILLSIILITHACKPAFKRRAAVVDGSAAGVMSALIFTLLSVAQLATLSAACLLTAQLLAIGWLIVSGLQSPTGAGSVADSPDAATKIA